MNEHLLVMIISSVSTYLVHLGMTRRQGQEQEKRLDFVEKETASIKERMHGLRDVYITQAHFNEIMQNMRETHREMREDMKKILDLLALKP